MSNKKDANIKDRKEKGMSDPQESYWFPIALLLVASILAVVNIYGFLIYPYIFSSFSVFVFVFISVLIIYVVYNTVKIFKEV
ncbi:MAG: hypothetical protein R6U96_14925 [Promethearchaeia archaeon]